MNRRTFLTLSVGSSITPITKSIQRPEYTTQTSLLSEITPVSIPNREFNTTGFTLLRSTKDVRAYRDNYQFEVQLKPIDDYYILAIKDKKPNQDTYLTTATTTNTHTAAEWYQSYLDLTRDLDNELRLIFNSEHRPSVTGIIQPTENITIHTETPSLVLVDSQQQALTLSLTPITTYYTISILNRDTSQILYTDITDLEQTLKQALKPCIKTLTTKYPRYRTEN